MGALTQLPSGAYEYRYPAQSYGEPYHWFCVVVPHGTTAEIRLAPGSHPDRADLEATLLEAGFTHARWERERAGSMHRTRTFRLRGRS